MNNAQTELNEEGRSQTKDAWLRLKRNYAAMGGLVVLIIMAALALITPWIAPYEYSAQNLALGATPPSKEHWLGTDTLGRDLLTRLLYGGRVSLMVGVIATLVALLIGVTWGMVAGYLGGRVDALMMRIVDVLYSAPFMIIVILLTVVFGQSMLLLFIAIGAVEWLTMARIVRGQTMALTNHTFVDAARLTGLASGPIIMRHILPNIMGSIAVYTTLTVPNIILFEAFLSFLGLGVQPPQSSWGLLIAYGVETMDEYPWLLIFPGLALSLTLFSLNFLGDGLRDALDPKGSE